MENPIAPVYSPNDADLGQLVEMFPHMDREIIEFVLVEVKGQGKLDIFIEIFIQNHQITLNK